MLAFYYSKCSWNISSPGLSGPTQNVATTCFVLRQLKPLEIA